MTEAENTEKKTNQKDMIKKIRKQNPGVKIKKTKNGGFQIGGGKAPSSLLQNLIKRLDKP
jgi:hypothetical protein